jgi:hypothetical protein
VVHVFLYLWAYNLNPCSGAFENEGKGHGAAWQDMACALERACRDREFLGLDVKLNGAQSFAREVGNGYRGGCRGVVVGQTEDGVEQSEESGLSRRFLKTLYSPR